MGVKSYRRGLVALSADPVTYGHRDLIRGAAEKCNEVIVLVANNERKKGGYCFTLKERTSMVERAIREAGIGNARIVGSSGLLIDTYMRENCDRLFRGIRNDKDLDYEREQEQLNCVLHPALKGHVEYLEAAENLRLVSSTMVKALVEMHCSVDEFVPLFVKQALEEKLLRQFRVMVTGGISVGKTWVAKQLALRAALHPGKPATHINIDQLLRSFYDEDSDGAQAVRDELAASFGPILTPNHRSVDRAALAAHLFRDGTAAEADRRYVTELTMPHVKRLYREALAGAEGLVIIEWAQAAEMAMGPWANNNVIVVGSKDRAKFAELRGISPERLASMDKIQWSADQKQRSLERHCAANGSGWVIRHEHSYHPEDPASSGEIEDLFWKILEKMPDLPHNKHK